MQSAVERRHKYLKYNVQTPRELIYYICMKIAALRAGMHMKFTRVCHTNICYTILLLNSLFGLV